MYVHSIVSMKKNHQKELLIQCIRVNKISAINTYQGYFFVVYEVYN